MRNERPCAVVEIDTRAGRKVNESASAPLDRRSRIDNVRNATGKNVSKHAQTSFSQVRAEIHPKRQRMFSLSLVTIY